MSEHDPILPELASGRGTAREAGSGVGATLRQSPAATATSPRKLGEDLRRDFPGLVSADGKPWHYLDSAATAQKPQAVIDAVARAIGADYATVHRGVYTRSAEMTLGYEAARRRVAQFVGGREDEIVFTRSATEAINLVAASYGRLAGIGEGDEIVISIMEHHSNIVPWHFHRERSGAVIKWAPVDDEGNFLLDEFEKLLTERTKIVAITHMSNVLGTVTPVKDIVRIAHARGIPVLVDGSQGAVHLPVDVRDLDADFYVFTAMVVILLIWPRGIQRGVEGARI